jgi:hypothetical protein
MTALHNQAATQLPHCDQATPGNRRTATRQLLHATSARTTTTLPAGTNGPFQGPTNFTEWTVYQNNGNSHRLKSWEKNKRQKIVRRKKMETFHQLIYLA